MKKKMTDSEMERVVSAKLNAALGGLDLRNLTAPQNKALMKKPQRTKASVSSSAPRSVRSRKLSKPAFETQMEQTLLAAVVKYGNNYQLAKLAGTSADIVSRFARKDRTLRLDTASRIADALGLRFQ